MAMSDVPETPTQKGSAGEILDERTRSDVTWLLGELSRGKKEALEQLMPLLYSELRRLASYHLQRESHLAGNCIGA